MKEGEYYILVIGCGKLVPIICEIAKLMGVGRVVGCLDDNPALWGKVHRGVPVFGAIDLFDCVLREQDVQSVFIGIGAMRHMRVREGIYRLIEDKPDLLPINLIHPNAVVSKQVDLGWGNIVMAGTVIDPGSRLGNNCIVFTNSYIAHDSIIGTNVYLAPGVILGGGTCIHDSAYIGLGANIVDRITIGSEAVVGAGSLVLRDVPSKQIWFGSPARFVRQNDVYLNYQVQGENER
jgi:sugar O-acyltransferase (sialic acid O-acetyltransferase NeuD family)